MSWLRRMGAGVLLRRTLRSLEGIEAQLVRQNDLLARLTDHLCPIIPEAVQTTTAQSGVDFISPIESVLVDQFVLRTHAEQGRPPTDDEIMRYLAEEETIGLQQRMMAEDAQR